MKVTVVEKVGGKSFLVEVVVTELYLRRIARRAIRNKRKSVALHGCQVTAVATEL